MSNYYQTLGVGKHASIDDIKKAYRKLAVKYHPDKNKEDPQAENKFKEIGEAYHVLSNPELRNKYDTYGTIDPQKDFSQHPFGGGFGNLHEAIFREFFGDSFFGGGVKAHKVKTGPSVKVTVSVTLQEVAKGVHKTIKFKQPVSCSTCEGEGVINKHTCDLCNGMGSRITGRNGMFFVQQSCPKCFGRGSWFDTKCLDCQGSGYIKRDKEISFKIPAGIHSGTKLRLKGLGGNPRQGSAGDLLVFVVVENHPQLVRKGNDLFHETFVNYSQAVLGDKIKVPSLDNQVVLTIPPGTQPGAVMRVKDKGILGGSLYVKVNLDVPTNPSKEYKKLVKKLSAIPQE